METVHKNHELFSNTNQLQSFQTFFNLINCAWSKNVDIICKQKKKKKKVK